MKKKCQRRPKREPGDVGLGGTPRRREANFSGAGRRAPPAAMLVRAPGWERRGGPVGTLGEAEE